MKPIIKVLLMAIAYFATFILGATSGIIHPACYAYIGVLLPLLTAFIYLYTSTLVKGFGAAAITATANDGSGKTATCSVTVYPAGTIVWDSSNISDLSVSGTYASYTKEGITLSANADMIDAWWSMDGISFNTRESGGYTFTAPTGKTFTKIEMMAKESNDWDSATLGSGWVYSGDYMTGIYKVTWTGNASTVNLLTDADHFSGSVITSIAFFLSE